MTRAFFAYLALAVLWTWPAAVSSNLPGLHGDAYVGAWALSAAPRVLAGFGHDALTAYPAGADYLRFDTWVLAGVATAFQSLPVARLHAALVVLGLASSATAAEALARAAGARAPWSMLAGLAYAFSGIAATAYLGGTAYFLLDPWLPLCALGCISRRDTLAVIGFAGALYTSAYTGLCAGLVFLVLARRPQAWLGAVITSLPWALAYALGARGQDAAGALAQASANVLSWGWPSPMVDVDRNSFTVSLPATALALSVAAPVVLRRGVSWRPFAALAVVAFVLALGPRLALGPDGGVVPLPFALLDLLGAGAIRFPARFLWCFGLGLGVVAALVASRLAEARPRATGLLLVAALVDTLVGTGLPWRGGTRLADVPSAYGDAEGPVLDLFPEPLDRTGTDHRFRAIACFYQSGHGWPIADDCVATDPALNPRPELARSVLAGGNAPEGFAAVALHADLFHPADRTGVEASLSRLDPSPVESIDGGERVLLYRIKDK